jgi:hypothetical protein
MMKVHRETMKGKTKTSSRSRKKFKLTPEMIDANKGFLGTDGKLLKIFMEEKRKER